MSRSVARWLGLAVVAGVALLAGWYVTASAPASTTPARPPRHLRAKAAEPLVPPREQGIAAFRDAQRAGSATPGEEAFRANAEAYVDLNLALAEQKAREEGLTVDEMRELTYLGLLALRLRQWDAVEHRLGHALPPEVRAEADTLIFGASDTLKATIRAQVARGESETERWATIQSTEREFVGEYRRLTGLDAAGFDALLGEGYAGE